MKQILLLCSILFSFTVSQAQTKVAPASVVMSAAYKLAGAQHKKVLLIYHASWCGWCRKMDSCLYDASCRKFFEDNFVITHLTIQESKDNKKLENPGAQAMAEKQGGKDQGLPYWVILDEKGKMLYNSRLSLDDKPSTNLTPNVGCPASEQEVKAFVNLLRKTTRLNEDALTAIFNRFRQNEQ